ncbi:hypothetical protein BDW75DRAFT_65360 [Aspergillus navahoensis]
MAAFTPVSIFEHFSDRFWKNGVPRFEQKRLAQSQAVDELKKVLLIQNLFPFDFVQMSQIFSPPGILLIEVSSRDDSEHRTLVRNRVRYLSSALVHSNGQHFPCLSAGALGIEVMGLIAFYLQCADRKEDAYIYAGMGLRIAILMGLHRDGGTSLTRSERVHCDRLWWTIYMQERRLAAAT